MKTTPASTPTLDHNWPLVAAGSLMGCVAIGVVFSLAVFLDPMGADTGWPRSGICGPRPSTARRPRRSGSGATSSRKSRIAASRSI